MFFSTKFRLLETIKWNFYSVRMPSCRQFLPFAKLRCHGSHVFIDSLRNIQTRTILVSEKSKIMSKLEDLLAKKKTVVPVLDLSKNVAQSAEELKRLMEKVPEFKMRPIKVRAEDIKTKEKDFSFKMSKKELKKLLKHNGERDAIYIYSDPAPLEMKDIVLYDLCVVPIDWKMLTTLRPKSKIEEEYFSRMVEMGKLQLKTEQRDKRDFILNNGVKKLKNKSGIVETRLQTCVDCGEELCLGKTCTKFSYDLFGRVEQKLAKPKPAPTVSNKGKLNGRKRAVTNGSRNKPKKN